MTLKTILQTTVYQIEGGNESVNISARDYSVFMRGFPWKHSVKIPSGNTMPIEVICYLVKGTYCRLEHHGSVEDSREKRNEISQRNVLQILLI